jgi:hypothetical protein
MEADRMSHDDLHRTIASVSLAVGVLIVAVIAAGHFVLGWW